MADVVVDRRPPPMRFFCHRCNIEFEEALQDFTCPYCCGGFIEQIETDNEVPHSVSGDETSDVDMTSLDSSDDQQDGNNTSLGDLSFLMGGRRLRTGPRESENCALAQVIENAHFLGMHLGGLIEPLSADIRTASSSSRSSRGMLDNAENVLRDVMVSMTGTSGTPVFLFTGTGAQDVVFSEGGLDAVVTQLLGQLEGSGPPPLPTARVDNLPKIQITPEHVEAKHQCSICWDQFNLGEEVRQLECKHIFHDPCIVPWLKLHATCPICRHCLLSDDEVNSSSATNLETPILQTISSLLVRAFPRPSTDTAPATTASSTSVAQGNTSNTSTEDKMSRYNCDLDYD